MSEIANATDVWVLAGQSNMQGCGLLSHALAPDERVQCYSSAGQWETANEPLHRLWESFTPVHQTLMRAYMLEPEVNLSDAELAAQEERDRYSGAGLGLAFGQYMADATGKPLGLIPASHGGTSLEQWDQNRKDERGDSLYGAMLERIERAGGNLRGILWYQGESDAVLEKGDDYAQRLEAWIAAARRDTGQPELPIFLVQLGRYVIPDNPLIAQHWDDVREALATLPQRIPHTAATSAVDLGLVDTIHIDTPGLIRLGHRLARLALQLAENPTIVPGPQVTRIESGKGHGDFGVARIVCSGVSGGWQPRHHMSGFTVRTADNEPHPTLQILDVSAEETDPRNIRILLSGPVTEGTSIAYGLGLDPYCNVVDEADMPLSSFLPRLIEQ